MYANIRGYKGLIIHMEKQRSDGNYEIRLEIWNGQVILKNVEAEEIEIITEYEYEEYERNSNK